VTKASTEKLIYISSNGLGIIINMHSMKENGYFDSVAEILEWENLCGSSNLFRLREKWI
jgi:hypothetical protein